MCIRDRVTIVISDMTRFWMRQDVICELLVKYLHDEMGVGYDQIAVVVALGTHRKNTAEDRRKLASEFVYDLSLIHICFQRKHRTHHLCVR